MTRFGVILIENQVVGLLQILQHNNDENLLHQRINLLGVRSRIEFSQVKLVCGEVLHPIRFVKVLHKPKDNRVLALQNFESHGVILYRLFVLGRHLEELVIEVIFQFLEHRIALSLPEFPQRDSLKLSLDLDVQVDPVREKLILLMLKPVG